MTPKKFRKMPVEIEAVQWDGDNAAELTEWTGGAFSEIDPEDRGDNPDATAELYVDANGVRLGIEQGEWVIRDARGFYPCKPDIFEATYEAVA